MDLSALTLTQLRYLCALDRERSFRAAAEHCLVTQPALSMQVQRVEQLLGLVVFDRSRQPILPTEPGARILAQARTILHEVERLREIAEHDGGHPAGAYRLGVIPTLASTLLPRLLPTFARRLPAVQLQVEEVPTDALLAGLERDQLDGGLAATPLEAPGVREQTLFREPLYAYLPPRHPLASRATVRQSELVGEALWLMDEGHCFRHQVLQLCRIDSRALQAQTPVRFQSGSFETLIRMVDRGFGVTVLPALSVAELPASRRREQVRPFAGAVPVRQVSLIRTREHLRRRLSEALATVVAEVLPSFPTSSKAWVVPPR
ncbi:MAG: hydrogen peroxide-inducible genes activator [Polyangiaceae bacterium]|nr:hydrogen peroxide-inducible genes activator [Polyangiaceae bacterium]